MKKHPRNTLTIVLGLSCIILAAVALVRANDRFHPSTGVILTLSHDGTAAPAASPTPNSRIVPRPPRTCSTAGPLTTVVGVYIKTPSKHTTSEYEQWMADYLRLITSPVVLYVANYPLENIRKMRGDRPIQIREINTTWDLPYAAELRGAYEGPQWSMDRERNHHKPELYAIWNAKTGVLAEVADENPFCSRYFIYADVGLFRTAVADGVISPWPQDERVLTMFANRSDLFVFGFVGQAHQYFLNEVQKFHAADPPPTYLQAGWRHELVIMGGFLAGDAAGVRRWAALFHPFMLAANVSGAFIGKDQEMYHYLAVREYPRGGYAFVGGRGCPDPWWYTTHLLAANTTCALESRAALYAP